VLTETKQPYAHNTVYLCANALNCVNTLRVKPNGLILQYEIGHSQKLGPEHNSASNFKFLRKLTTCQGALDWTTRTTRFSVTRKFFNLIWVKDVDCLPKILSCYRFSSILCGSFNLIITSLFKKYALLQCYTHFSSYSAYYVVTFFFRVKKFCFVYL